MIAKEVFHIKERIDDPYEVCIELEKEADVLAVIKILNNAKENGLVNFPWGISFSLTAIDDEGKSAGIIYPKL